MCVRGFCHRDIQTDQKQLKRLFASTPGWRVHNTVRVTRAVLSRCLRLYTAVVTTRCGSTIGTAICSSFTSMTPRVVHCCSSRAATFDSVVLIVILVIQLVSHRIKRVRCNGGADDEARAVEVERVHIQGHRVATAWPWQSGSAAIGSRTSTSTSSPSGARRGGPVGAGRLCSALFRGHSGVLRRLCLRPCLGVAWLAVHPVIEYNLQDAKLQQPAQFVRSGESRLERRCSGSSKPRTR